MTETSEWYRGWLIKKARYGWSFQPPAGWYSAPYDAETECCSYALTPQGCMTAIDRQIADREAA